MMRTGLALCACLLLAGCGSVAARREFPRHYTLVGAAIPVAHTPRPRARDALQVARITAPPWLAGTAMYYRLEYRAHDQLAAYTLSDWAAPPARLLQPVVMRALAEGSDWRIVTGPANPAAADFSLYIRLDDFSQAFTSAHRSVARLDATATLVGNHDATALEQRYFRVEVPATRADAAGGAAALNHASRQFASALQHWLAAVHASAGHARRAPSR